MKKLLIAITTFIFITVGMLIGTSATEYNDIIVNNVDFDPYGMNEYNNALVTYDGEYVPLLIGGTINVDITWINNPNKNTTSKSGITLIGQSMTTYNYKGNITYANYYNAHEDSNANDYCYGNVTATWNATDIDTPVTPLVVRYLLSLASFDVLNNIGDTLTDINRTNPLTVSALNVYVDGSIADDTNTLGGTTRTDTFTSNEWLTYWDSTPYTNNGITIIVTSHFAELGIMSDMETYRQGYDAGVNDGSTVGYTNGYNVGYTNGQTDPNGAQYKADLQAQYQVGYSEGSKIANPLVYQQGYNDGQDDLRQVLDMSNLTTEQSGIGAFIAPLNSAWVMAVDIYDWFVNHPIGSIIIALVAFVLTMALGFTIIKVIL